MKKYFIILITIALISSCKEKNENEINLRFDWIPTMSFSGDIVAENKYSKENKIKLKLNPAGEGIDPIKMIISGNDDIGIVGLDKLLLANEKGANLIAIGIIDNISPTVFLTKKESGITNPYEFVGRKVGIQSGGATEYVYQSLMSKLNIDRLKVDELNIGFDMNSFINDEYEVRPGFIFDEALYLESNNIKFNLINPVDYGLKYPGRVYFAKKDFIKNNPELIQSFVNSVSQGWEYALKNPKEAIELLKNLESQIEFDREYNGLIKAKTYFSGFENKILNPDINSIDEMTENLINLKVLKTKPNFEDYFNTSFVDKYHNK